MPYVHTGFRDRFCSTRRLGPRCDCAQGFAGQDGGRATTRAGPLARAGECAPLGCAGTGGDKLGVSLAAGPLAGVGFWRDHLIRPEYASRDDLSDEMRAEAARRAEEAALLRRMLDGRGSDAQALALRTDVSSYMPVPFVEAVRRRLAYALAYEVTLASQSFDPIVALHDVAVGGTVDALAAALPAVSDGGAFSLALNLFDLVSGLAAYAKRAGTPPPEHPTVLRDSRAKKALLDARMGEAGQARIAALGRDGAIALAALLAAAREADERGMIFVARPALWGCEPDSQRYRDDGDDLTLPPPRD